MKARAFKFLLSGGENDGLVLVEEFSRILYWFGPLEDDTGNVDAKSMLIRLEDQLSKKYENCFE